MTPRRTTLLSKPVRVDTPIQTKPVAARTPPKISKPTQRSDTPRPQTKTKANVGSVILLSEQRASHKAMVNLKSAPKK